MLLTPKDLNFVGYTYKNFDAIKGLKHSYGMRCYLVEISIILSISIVFSCFIIQHACDCLVNFLKLNLIIIKQDKFPYCIEPCANVTDTDVWKA